MNDLDVAVSPSGAERNAKGSTDQDARPLFVDLRAWITRFVALGEHEATVIALWVMLTHVIDAFECAPYLSVTSAEKQCGKTRLLEVLELVVARPWLTGRTTPAVLARKIDAHQPTLLLDESDATFRGDKEFAQALRGVLNTGYLRSGKTSLCVTRGKTIEFADFSTFGPKAIAGIGALPDTVADRSIPIRLQRKLPGESVERFRRRKARADADIILSRLGEWARTFGTDERPEPSIPLELPDRAADIAEPLLVIAEACGADVATSARAALKGLCGRHREDDSLGIRLLSDVRIVFEESGEERLASATLAARLAAMEESPWEPRFGRDFDARALAKLLRPFAIRPAVIRLRDDSTPRGYHRNDFIDAWDRFTPRTGNPQQPHQPQRTGEVRAPAAPARVRCNGASVPLHSDRAVMSPAQRVLAPG